MAAWNTRAVAPAQAEPIGYFIKQSDFGPWIEVEPTTLHAKPLYEAPAAPVQAEPAKCSQCDDEGVIHGNEGMQPCHACQDVDDDAPASAGVYESGCYTPR